MNDPFPLRVAGKLPGERRSKKRGASVEFDDFRMLGSADAEAERVVRRFPDLRDFLVG